MIVVPLQDVPSQTVGVTLGNQACEIHVYQRSTGLFFDLTVANQLVVGGVIAHDRNRLVRSAYLGFVGDLAFVDTLGSRDPVYTGLVERYLLIYFAPEELIASPEVVPYWVPPTAAAPGSDHGSLPDPSGVNLVIT
jgi:hypothetical protein